MAESDMHKSKRKKNLAVLALVLGWCLLIFIISITRMARAEDGPVPLVPGIASTGAALTAETEMGAGANTDAPPETVAAPADLPAGAFADARVQHRAHIEETGARWLADRQAGAAARNETDAARDAARAEHVAESAATATAMNQSWQDKGADRQSADAARDQARQAHRDNLETRPGAWWQSRLNP